MRIVLVALLVLLAGLSSRLSAQPAEPPARLTLSLEGQAVVASGLHPRGQIAWFGVARELDDGWATIVRREEVASDTDGDGVVRLELHREVPLQSVWVAVDLTNGKYAVTAPDGFPLEVVELPRRGLGRGQGAGAPDFLEIDRSFVETLVVRPGVGAWGASVGDGGSDDGPPGDRRVTANLGRMSGVRGNGGNGGGDGNGAALERFQPRDVVIVVDPNRLDVAIGQVTAEQQEGPRP